MNGVEAAFQGHTYHLLFNGHAMFAVQELFGERELSDVIFTQTAEGLDALVTVFCMLAEQGELARRYEGYDAGGLPDAEQLRLAVMPADLPGLRGAVMKAILKGYGREIEEEETDLGLAELQKKRKAPRRGRTTSAREP